MEDRLKRARFYRAIWRWHFYAGLFVAPILVTLAVSGGLYLYKNELESLWYGSLVAGSQGAALPLSQQQAAVAAAFPGAELRQVSLPPDEGRASEWKLVTPGGDNRTAFVDPATGVVNGSIETSTRLMAVLADIHGGDIIAPVGGYLVELAACWALVLIFSGLYLWWPRGRRGGVFAPRLRSRGRRLLRDLHAVPAMWNAAIVIFLVLSGLPWSTFWGVQLSKLGTLSSVTAPSPNFETSDPVQHDQHLKEAGRDIPWSIRHAPTPQGGHSHHDAGASPPGLDDLMALAAANGIDRPGLRLFLRRPSEHGTIMLSYVPDTAEEQRTINLDPSTGAILRDAGWAEYSPLAKVVELGTMTHMGREFGEPNRLLMLASCIVLLMTVVVGVLMWWRRRPATSGAGVGVPRTSVGGPVIAIAVALGILFPLLGASLILVGLAEALIGIAARRKPVSAGTPASNRGETT